MKLIDDVKGAWRHYSTIALSTAGAVQAAGVATPDLIRDGLPKGVNQWVSTVTVFILFWGLIGKFIKQGGDDDQQPQAK